MAHPLPINVALVGATSELLRKAKRHFRLTQPGIGAAHLATLEISPDRQFQHIEQIPKGLILLWIALDERAQLVTMKRFESDSSMPTFNRGFYEDLLPDACVLIDFERSPKRAKTQLSQLAAKVTDAWLATS